MAELIRDTAFGHIVRFVSRGKYLQYEEERDSSIWTKYVDEKQSGYLAHHGTTDPPEDGEEPETMGGVRTREDGLHEKRSDSNSSSQTEAGEGNLNRASGVKVDPEKGKDFHVVSWYSDTDEMNPQNWSLFKKCFVTFEICLLTTSIYIGSSIYSAGTTSVEETFGVSQVAATLGLTLFVAGYGTGPMIWSPMSEVSTHWVKKLFYETHKITRSLKSEGIPSILRRFSCSSLCRLRPRWRLTSGCCWHFVSSQASLDRQYSLREVLPWATSGGLKNAPMP